MSSLTELDYIEYRITNGIVLIDYQDYELIRNYKWSIHANHNKTLYYARTEIKRATIEMQRLIMNPIQGLQVDHINHNGLDNRRKNLRIVTVSQNQANSRKHNGSSKYKGVYLKKEINKWTAGIKYNNKRIHIGYFHNEVDAAIAYDLKAKELFGEYALLNFLEKENS